MTTRELITANKVIWKIRLRLWLVKHQIHHAANGCSLSMTWTAPIVRALTSKDCAGWLERY